VKGLARDHADRIAGARNQRGSFQSITDFQRRTGLARHAIERLAHADAFGSMGLSRRQALWQTLELTDCPAPLFDECREETVQNIALPVMPIQQEVLSDYATAGLSLKQHPLVALRPRLCARRIIRASELAKFPTDRWTSVAGLVLIRQRPGTASGIVFVTLEDETGIANLIIRPHIYDRFRSAARHASLLQAEGYVERQGQVIHLMVHRMHDLSPWLTDFSSKSRDFR